MARPPKEGLDYFLLDCSLDNKFRLIEAEFGLTGFAVVVKLLQQIYGGFGYYCEWTEEVALLFASDCKVGGNAVSEIVSASIKRGIFDSKLFDEYHILTSTGIQKRYFEAVKRRKVLEIKSQYLLVKVDQIIDNDNISIVYVDINSENDSNNPQSKGKKSKEKKSKESIVQFWEKVWNLYPMKRGKGQVSYSQKEKLYVVGFDELSRCIERYKTDKPEWREYQNGSTFFNSGYIDYLDDNYTPPEKVPPPPRKNGQGASYDLDAIQHKVDYESVF